MGKSSEVLCKWTKSRIRKESATLLALVEHPTHVCLDCGRAAGSKKVLCEPQSLAKLRDKS